MISFKEAIKIVEENIPQRETATLPLINCAGYFLAEDLFAKSDFPPYTNSAMDGFAIKWDDIEKGNLKIVGESQAGLPFRGKVNEGEAVKISTGALIPDGADAVVKFEDCKFFNHSVSVLGIPEKGDFIRRKGEDISVGDKILNSGTFISAAQISLLVSVGIKEIKVFDKPKVAVIATGTELGSTVEVEEPFKIPNSNMLMLEAAVRESGGEINNSKFIKDDLKLITELLIESARKNKIIITTGGASNGEHDHIKDAAYAAGFTQLFSQVNQKPGRNMYFGKNGDTILFGLPGTPSATLISYFNFVHPSIRRLTGTGVEPDILKGLMLSPYINSKEATLFREVKLLPNRSGCSLVQMMERKSMLSNLAEADGYIELAPGIQYKKCEPIEVHIFNRRKIFN